MRVRVFLMAVDKLLDTWPEQDQRAREWFTLAQAAAAVDEPELAEIIRQLDNHQPAGAVLLKSALKARLKIAAK